MRYSTGNKSVTISTHYRIQHLPKWMDCGKHNFGIFLQTILVPMIEMRAHRHTFVYQKQLFMLWHHKLLTVGASSKHKQQNPFLPYTTLSWADSFKNFSYVTWLKNYLSLNFDGIKYFCTNLKIIGMWSGILTYLFSSLSFSSENKDGSWWLMP